MIQLFTGIPGSGKTLSNVMILHSMIEGWKKIQNFDSARPIFVHNIPDLLISHAKMPLKEYQPNGKGDVILVPDWDAMPDTSIVLIDECAEMFPPRSSASAMPPHVLFLTVHRKRGFDIWFTTQNPKFIDHSLRALVAKHQHYRRVFGMNRSIVYEWDGCSDNLGGLRSAVKTYFPFPRDIYKLYKSAEVHTKQKFKLPLWMYIPLVGLAMSLFFIPRAYGVLSGAIGGKGIDASVSEGEIKRAGVQSSAPPASVGGALAPPLELAGGAEAFTPPKAQLISACVASEQRCVCYTHHGVKVHLSDTACRESAAELNDRFRLDAPEARFVQQPLAPVVPLSNMETLR